MKSLKEEIKSIKEIYSVDSNFDLANHMIKHYYRNYYQGEELDKTFNLYTATLWFELTFWIGRNETKISSKNFNVNNFFKINIIRAKLNTLDRRQKIYRSWMCKSDFLKKDNNPDYNLDKELLDTLNMMFPDFTEPRAVKLALGLGKTKKELEKELGTLDVR